MADKPVLEMNSIELRTLKMSLNDENSTPEQREQLDERIMDITIDERVASGLAKGESRKLAHDLDEQAKSRWPSLRDEESQFRKDVVAEMAERGDSETNPRAMNDAANAVAMKQGLVQEGWKPAEATIQAHNIKAPGHQDGGGEGGSAESLTENNPVFDSLVKAGFLSNDNEESKARIEAAGEALKNG